MKGLISTSPAFATVGISSRCARKYYGTESDKDYIEGMHDVSRRYVLLGTLCKNIERTLTFLFTLVVIGVSIQASGRSEPWTGS